MNEVYRKIWLSHKSRLTQQDQYLLAELVGAAYGFGVTAGKKEALGYNEKESLAYVKNAAFADGFSEAKKFFGTPDDEIPQL